MGGFKNAVPAAAGVATTYYSTKKGANFGGYCSNASCPSQALAGAKQVSFCAGMVRAARRFCSIFFARSIPISVGVQIHNIF
jgi:hypothetical protein